MPFFTLPQKFAKPVRRVACLLAMLMAFAALAQAENTELTLKNGASVKGDVLKRTDERIVLDLGFQIILVPTSEILAESKTETTDDATTATATSQKIRKVRRGGSFKELVDDLKPGIVGVSNAAGSGAGFIIDPRGLILTNHHVIEGEKYQDVTILLSDGKGGFEKKKIRKVEVKGFSSVMDCALLKLPDEELKGVVLTVLDIAKPESIRTGLPVFAIGNPGLGYKILDHSVSEGILSSTTRNFNDLLYLQTTAAINPGNSGGPLLNSEGEVVGLVTFRASFQEGMGFALPAYYLKHFVAHVQAFAPGEDSLHLGYRYHDPSEGSEEKE